MQGKVQLRGVDTILVFLERVEGAEACDQLLTALGAAARGQFKPQFEPERSSFAWARYYAFHDPDLRDAAHRLLRDALEGDDSQLSGWGIHAAAGRLIARPPAERSTVARGFERLRAALGHGTPPGALLSGARLGAAGIDVRLGDPELAAWLGRALAHFCAQEASYSGTGTPAIDGSSAQPAPTSGAPIVPNIPRTTGALASDVPVRQSVSTPVPASRRIDVGGPTIGGAADAAHRQTPAPSFAGAPTDPGSRVRTAA